MQKQPFTDFLKNRNPQSFTNFTGKHRCFPVKFAKFLRIPSFYRTPPVAASIHGHETLFKGELSGLTQFLATESPLKLMRNAFYFTSKSLFILKIFKFWSRETAWLSTQGFKIYDVKTWWTNSISRSKSIVYRITNGLEVYYFHFLFN